MTAFNAVILNGERDGENLLAPLQSAVEAALAERECAFTRFDLRAMKVDFCRGCFGCWVQSPGECVRDDDARAIARALIRADLLVALTAVTFGCYSSVLKRAIERTLPLGSPFFQKVGDEVHHKARYPKFPDYLVLGVQEKPDADSAGLFETLVDRNAINIKCRIHRTRVFARDATTEDFRTALEPLLAGMGVSG